MVEDWTLDERLAADTHPITQGDGILVRLVDDARWPWVMLVPQRAAREINDLPPDLLAALMARCVRCAVALKTMAPVAAGPAASTNVATLGNVVRAFHLHVVGRRPGDPGWPGPVWGHGAKLPYDAATRDAFVEAFLRAYEAADPSSDRFHP